MKVNSLDSRTKRIGRTFAGSPIKLGNAVLLASIASNSFAYNYDEGGLSDELSIVDAVQKGHATLDFRLRYEDARQAMPSEQGAQALTLRSRVSYETQRFQLFSAYLQFDDISAFPSDENYNSGSNGQLDDVLIADPETTGLSQAWLAYDIANTLFRYGRQGYSLDDGRMVGKESWRQNEQVFTGLSIQNESLNYLRFKFAKFDRVEQAYAKASNDLDSSVDINLFNIHYRGFLLNDLSIYHLNIDDYAVNPLWETSTSGVYFSGNAGGGPSSAKGNDFSLAYFLEYAQQKSSGENPVDYRAAYKRLELNLAYQGFGLLLGQEVLGADRQGMFITPLADLHEFQGWADQAVGNELGNVAGGVEDLYWGLEYSCSESFKLAFNYHDYDFDKPAGAVSSIGSEWGLLVDAQLNEYSFSFKYADYSASSLGEDTTRAWISLGANF
jgi:Alginate export